MRIVRRSPDRNNKFVLLFYLIRTNDQAVPGTFKNTIIIHLSFDFERDVPERRVATARTCVCRTCKKTEGRAGREEVGFYKFFIREARVRVAGPGKRFRQFTP